MKKQPSQAIAEANPTNSETPGNNGNATLVAEPIGADLSVILATLQAMRDGDFSVRLPAYWTGLGGRSRIRSTPLWRQISRWRES